MDGSTPQVAQDIIFPNISKLFFSANSLVVSTTAAAPSLIPDEFPGVTVPFSLKTEFNLERSFIVIPVLGCSSISSLIISLSNFFFLLLYLLYVVTEVQIHLVLVLIYYILQQHFQL